MKTKMFLGAMALCAAMQMPAVAQTAVHPCTLQESHYSCDRGSLEAALSAAKTISIQVPQMDAHSARKLRELVVSLGKTAEPGSGDLTIVLTRPEPTGIDFGPSNRLLARISIYAGTPQSGQPIWVDSYSDQPDTPWPVAAHRVIDQLRTELKEQKQP